MKPDPNADARSAIKKLVPVAKPVPIIPNPPPASIFSLMKSKLPTKDTRGPVQVKPKSQPAKGKEEA